jgi:cell division septation protein DedD
VRLLFTYCAVVAAAAVLAAGCGQEEPVTRAAVDTTAVVQQPVKPAAPEVESRTDTVISVRHDETDGASPDTTGAAVRFTVQVGAFKDPQLASAIQAETRKRYHLPVLNDYYATLGLYQIRVGFFATREEAHQFRQKMIDEFPADYKDSWVVQIRR